LIRAYGRV